MRATAWALALATVASVATAITLDDCEDVSTATSFTYDFTKKCYKGTVRLMLTARMARRERANLVFVMARLETAETCLAPCA